MVPVMRLLGICLLMNKCDDCRICAVRAADFELRRALF